MAYLEQAEESVFGEDPCRGFCGWEGTDLSIAAFFS